MQVLPYFMQTRGIEINAPILSTNSQRIILRDKSAKQNCFLCSRRGTIKCRFFFLHLWYAFRDATTSAATLHHLRGAQFPSWVLQFPSTSQIHASHCQIVGVCECVCVCVCLQCPVMTRYPIQEVFPPGIVGICSRSTIPPNLPESERVDIF